MSSAICRRLASSFVLLVLLATAVAGPARGQLADGGKLLPSIPSPLTGSVGAVAIDGDLAVVGTSVNYGYVFVFERTATGWIERAAIQDPSPMVGVPGYFSDFGAAVAISGTTIVVGSPSHGEGLTPDGRCCEDARIGAAHVFELKNGEWELAATLTLATHADGFRDKNFGWAVAIRGDTLFASTINGWGGDNQSWHGIIARFTRSGGAWSHAETFRGPATRPSDDFGVQLVVQGNTLLTTSEVTTDDSDSVTNQFVHVYEEVGDAWLYREDLVSDSVDEDALFGVGLAVHEGVAVVGARTTNGRGQQTLIGAVHVFMRGEHDGAWGEVQVLSAGDPSAGAQFGFPLVLDGSTLLAGSRFDSSNRTRGGSIYHFERAGTAFIQIAKLVPGDNALEDRFGSFLALDGGTALVVAPGDDDLGPDNGSIYVYDCGDDTDEDGLCDTWETLGIPYYISDGSLQRYVLDVDGDGFTDANPMHKDLFVEVDSMQGRTFPGAAQAQVEAAFDIAPVDNPDLDIGIDLHLQLDDADLPFEELVVTQSGFPANFQTLRDDHFGTAAERALPDAEAMLAARAKAFRYVLNANRGQLLESDGSTPGIGGIAEMPGDEMVLYATGYDDRSFAAVFMHELGHNLRLGHGGGDNVNGKPNYPSIMNYTFGYPEFWNEDFWVLDYCREDLGVLREDALDETTPPFAGSSGIYTDFMLPYHAILPEGSDACGWDPSDFGQPVTEYLSLDPQALADWNLDCDNDDVGVVGDLNNLASSALPGSVTASPGQRLKGFDDWSNVRLGVSDGGGAFKGALPPDELTDEQRQFMRDHFPAPVPEPGSAVQLLVGTAGVLSLSRRGCTTRPRC